MMQTITQRSKKGRKKKWIFEYKHSNNLSYVFEVFGAIDWWDLYVRCTKHVNSLMVSGRFIFKLNTDFVSKRKRIFVFMFDLNVTGLFVTQHINFHSHFHFHLKRIHFWRKKKSTDTVHMNFYHSFTAACHFVCKNRQLFRWNRIHFVVSLHIFIFYYSKTFMIIIIFSFFTWNSTLYLNALLMR